MRLHSTASLYHALSHARLQHNFHPQNLPKFKLRHQEPISPRVIDRKIWYNDHVMKKGFAKAFLLTPQKKVAAKANILKSMLTSFKIEGVTFSPKQIESIKSRSHFSK